MIFIIRVLYPFRAFKRSNPFPQISFVKKVLNVHLKVKMLFERFDFSTVVLLSFLSSRESSPR